MPVISEGGTGVIIGQGGAGSYASVGPGGNAAIGSNGFDFHQSAPPPACWIGATHALRLISSIEQGPRLAMFNSMSSI